MGEGQEFFSSGPGSGKIMTHLLIEAEISRRGGSPEARQRVHEDLEHSLPALVRIENDSQEQAALPLDRKPGHE